jgi:hypothetical protein
MRHLLVAMMLACFLAGTSTTASGVEMKTIIPDDLFGLWTQQLKFGTMHVEFTDRTMATWATDLDGNSKRGSRIAPVHYASAGGNVVWVEFDTPGGGGAAVTRIDANTILLDFPGAIASVLKRASK